MSPQGFFGDPTSALLPATALSGTNGNWFFGRPKFGRRLSKAEKRRCMDYSFDKIENGLSTPEKIRCLDYEVEYDRGRVERMNKQQKRLAQMKKRRPKRSKFGLSQAEGVRIAKEYGGSRKGGKNTLPQSNELRKKRAHLRAQRRHPSFGGTHSDSLSGMVKPGPPNMRTFPMLGAYPGEVGPGNTPGGTAYNGSFVGPENPLMSYYFTYGRRRSARKGVRRSIRKGQKSKAKQLIHDTISKPITDYKGMYKPISKPISSMTRDGLIKNLRKFRDSWEKITGKYQDLSDERLNAESTDQLRKHIKFYYSESAKKLAENWLRNYV